MAHGENAEARNGKDWWGKRPLSGLCHDSGRMRFWKRLLHKIERRQGKKEIEAQLTINRTA